jgi:hypothetical protein
LPLIRPALSTSLVLSQIYGGGGNAGAPYQNDFIELYNLGGVAVDVTGWSVQYASAGGSAWQVTALSGSIPPGGYYLIQEASGGAAGAPLPPADATGAINLAAGAGKVALVNTATALTCGVAANDCFPNAAIVDFVGYGAAANNFEGAGSAPAPSNTTSIARSGGGGVDTDNNNTDFAAGAPNPRNSGSVSTSTPTPTATPTPTPTGTATVPATPVPAQYIVINEVAWGGTAAQTTDEWIELYNPNGVAVNLSGWVLASGTDGTPNVTLTGVIAANGYYLLERTDDTTISDLSADQIYVGDLGNGGEALTLRDSGGNLVDSANGDGGAWPAGSGSPGFYSMERLNPSVDSDSNWAGNNGVNRNGLDALGTPLNGTPRQANSTTFATPTPTQTLTPTPTSTTTVTATPTITATLSPRAVVINEIAWPGTAASSSDEWMELYNPGAVAVDLGGWSLSDGGDINIIFPTGFTISANRYLLLERTSDTTVSDITADLLYVGGLSNTGESLTLRDPGGNMIDTANGDGGAWPAGNSAAFATMERITSGPDADGNWRTHTGTIANGLDAAGAPLRGTPRRANSTPGIPVTGAGVRLNEFLPSPAGGASEFIELFNTGAQTADLSGWQLDDAAGGSSPYSIPGGTTLAPGAFLVYYQSTTGIAINNSGDSVRLLAPDGSVVDEWAFGSDPGDNVSWARLPDGGAWHGRGLPTPGGSNMALPEPPKPTPVPIGVFRTWPAGAWATISGRVTVPAPLFGRRYLYIQDETGGIALYLGRGDWPVLEPGQRVTVLGYQRVQSGQIQLYVRNRSLTWFDPPDGLTIAPRLGAPIGGETVAQLLTLVGRVVRLESQAFWLDTGAATVRVFFPSSTGLRRPKVTRGQVWSVTGVLVEMAATRTRAAGYQLQPRFASDLQPLTGIAPPTVTPAPHETLIAPTEEPTATAGP